MISNNRKSEDILIVILVNLHNSNSVSEIGKKIESQI